MRWLLSSHFFYLYQYSRQIHLRQNLFIVKKILCYSFLLLAISKVQAQTTYLPLNTEEYHLLDRLETMNGTFADEFYTSFKPIARKGAVEFLSSLRRIGNTPGNSINDIDYYDIQRAISISGEWSETAEGDDGAINSRKPILKYFYQKQPDMIHVNSDGLYLVVNPVIYFQGMKENNQEGLKYINTRGAEIRGKIFNRIGFYTMFADNQEKPPSFVYTYANRYQAYPGNDYYTNPSNDFDNIIARGYVDIGALNEHLNITFGYDKQFAGDGMRSLFHSDFGAPATFLRLRARFWKIMYESLYLELTPQYQRGDDQQLPHSYATFNQASMNVLPWLNVGLFESTLFSQKDKYQVQDIVPVMFYNTIARSLGANQKTSLGFNFKALAAQRIQLYGQAYFDQLNVSKLSDGWWGNQFGIQLGAKYFNAFSIHNLDLQVEGNVVRPFTYSSNDSVTNYASYNQPLAHPYGAGFAEFIFNVRYQPLPKLYLSAKGIVSKRGDDPMGGYNNGNDIFKPVSTRPENEGFGLTGFGTTWTGLYLNPNVSYELRPNLFIDAGVIYQKGHTDIYDNVIPNSTTFYGGLRLNIARKEYDGF